MDDWSPCPRCGSNRVKTLSKIEGFGACLIVSLALLIFGMFFHFLLWGTPIILALAIITLFTKKRYKCKDCEYVWIPNNNPKVSDQ